MRTVRNAILVAAVAALSSAGLAAAADEPARPGRMEKHRAEGMKHGEKGKQHARKHDRHHKQEKPAKDKPEQEHKH